MISATLPGHDFNNHRDIPAGSDGPLCRGPAAPVLAVATGLRVVLIKIGLEGRVATRLARFYASIGWPVRSTE